MLAITNTLESLKKDVGYERTVVLADSLKVH